MLAKPSHKILCLVLAVVATTGCASKAPAYPALALASPSAARTGLIIPMYAYPGAAWDTVVEQKLRHPRVPIILIANPDSGPGTQADPNYQRSIAKARAAGLLVLGYVHTSYGRRPQSEIESEVARFKQWYGVDGIFLDEMATAMSPYYQAITAYTHGLGLFPVVGNTGVDAPPDSGTDVINYYEDTGYPTAAFLSEPVHLQNRATWSYIAGDVPLDSAAIVSSLPYVGFLYATDGSEPECYCHLPSYFAALVTLLDQ